MPSSARFWVARTLLANWLIKTGALIPFPAFTSAAVLAWQEGAPGTETNTPWVGGLEKEDRRYRAGRACGDEGEQAARCSGALQGGLCKATFQWLVSTTEILAIGALQAGWTQDFRALEALCKM